MKLPDPRGPLSAEVTDYLRGQRSTVRADAPADADEDDLALTLWTLFELHYRGFTDVDPDSEWDPALITLRNALERDLERELRDAYATWSGPRDLAGMVAAFEDGPGLADFIRTRADAGQVRAILRQKSVYHLKESDPHCFVLARLPAGPKAALAELQYDELGNGVAERVHSRLFADALEGAGLDPSYGAYVEQAWASTLQVSNALSMLCLRRRLRHASVGHLAAFETTSSLPCAAIVRGLRRLGMDERVVRYYDEHVEADAVHEQLAWDGICAPLIAEDPAAADEIMFGAFVCLELERRNSRDLLADLA